MGFTAVGSIMGFHLASREYPEISLLVGQAAKGVREARHIKGSTSFEDFSSPRPLGAHHRQAQQSQQVTDPPGA